MDIDRLFRLREPFDCTHPASARCEQLVLGSAQELKHAHCFSDGFLTERKLRKIEISLEKVKSSLIVSENKLGKSKELFEAGFFEESVVNAYTSMFHSARALLYREGIQEKAHYAVYIYLKEKYSRELGSLIESFLYYQQSRKEILYGFNHSSNKDEAENIIDDAERFIDKIKVILELKK